LHARTWRLLAGDDTPERAGLPIAELLAPIPLVLLGVLVTNDWVLKPTSLPAWLTGKLSDFAGLAVFPLVATAAFDLILLLAWKLGARVDFTLRRWKLATAIALTAIGFIAMKLVPDVALAIARVLGALVGHSRIVADPTDLIALPALGVAWWFGTKTIARGAYGRLAWAQRAKPTTVYERTALDEPARAWLAGGDVEPVRAALAKARA
jgi:hypothetical protein